jgi:hypothetical protein
MINQFVSLERRVGRGRASIDHPPGQHDDVANCVAGAIVYAVGDGAYDHSMRGFADITDPTTDPGILRGQRARRAMNARIAEICKPPQPPADLLDLIRRCTPRPN